MMMALGFVIGVVLQIVLILTWCAYDDWRRERDAVYIDVPVDDDIDLDAPRGRQRPVRIR